MKNLRQIIIPVVIFLAIVDPLGETFCQDGIIDSSFANNGVYYALYQNSGFTSLEVQQDNKIVGASFTGFIFIRLNPDGTPDTSFANNGYLSVLSDEYSVRDIAIQSDGGIIGVGRKTNSLYPNWSRAVLVKINPNGTLDTSFNNTGVLINMTEPIQRAYSSVLLQTDNKILVSGHAYFNSNSIDDIILCQYNQDGSIDSTFGINGIAQTEILNSSESCTKILFYPNEKIIASALTHHAKGSRGSILTRYYQNGTIDSSFANNGILLSDIGMGTSFFHHSILVQNEGKILFAGRTNTSDSKGLLKQYLANGIIDSTFGNNGIVIVNSAYGIKDIIRQWDNKIIAALDNGFTIARFNSNGLIDTTFGDYGYTTTIINSHSFWERCYSLALQHGGKIIAGGVSSRSIPYSTADYLSMTRYFSGLDCPTPIANFSFQAFDSIVYFQDLSSSANKWLWEFGDSTFSNDQNPSHIYSLSGKFFVCLNISDTCGTSSYCDTIEIPQNSVLELLNKDISIFPNPITNILNIRLNNLVLKNLSLFIFNAAGSLIHKEEQQNPDSEIEINAEMFKPGLYFLQIISQDHIILKKFIKP